jgi:7,8-dihydropterin-6-yl-methyl-4-(beta-D-ribofuranosyl)aminobenzene 5'-phosphate synthase
MIISILTDNNPGAHTPAEHGLSYLIEYDQKRLLFDTGQSDMFIKNAEAMNINMANIDMIVLSHGHFDHGNGLQYLSGFSLLCHPGCFVKRYGKSDNSYIGLRNSKEELAEKYSLHTSTEPYEITKQIFFLGEIPRITDFESVTTSFILENGFPDYVMDDSALAIILPDGLFVVTGCGHAGVVNTLEHTKRVTGVNKICCIMGGFHLKENNNQTKETIRYLKKNRVKNVYPSHCTDIPALSAFHKNFGISLVRTGDVMNF